MAGCCRRAGADDSQLPDQHPGAERRGGSRTSRRAGTRLCRCGQRGAQPGRPLRRCGQGDQGTIGASVEKVEIGARQVNQAGASMHEIVAQVQRVTQLISEISNATTEQTSGISQVGDAVTQLDQVTQQNAALVEESAAAAESLRHQAAQLAEIVSVFKIGQGSPAPSARSAPAHSASAPANAPVAERRGPGRATNVTRPTFKAKPASAQRVRELARSSAVVGERAAGRSDARFGPVRGHRQGRAHGPRSGAGVADQAPGARTASNEAPSSSEGRSADMIEVKFIDGTPMSDEYLTSVSQLVHDAALAIDMFCEDELEAASRGRARGDDAGTESSQ